MATRTKPLQAMSPDVARELSNGTTRGRIGRDEEGQALVEFGLVLPLLLMLIMGILQCGILLNNWIVLTDAVRSGMRELTISRLAGVNACTNATAMLKSSAFGLDSASIGVTYTVASSCTSLTEGSAAKVAATYPCNLSILGINYAPGCTLNATTTGRVE